MTKNEIVARFMGWFQQEGQPGTWFFKDEFAIRVAYSIHNNYPHQDLPFSRDYNKLHEAWVKFRDLSFVGLGLDDWEKRRRFSGHQQICDYIREAITDGTITEAFDELVKGIEWYNNLNQKS